MNITELNGCYKLHRTLERSGTNIAIYNAKNSMVQGLTIYGNSEVVDGEIKSVGDDGLTVQTTGKNLLEITAESQTINGVTFTVDKAAGTITVNGTATANTGLIITPNIINIFGGMKLSGSAITGNDRSAIIITYYKEDGSYQSEQYSYNGAIITLLNSSKVNFSIFVFKDTTVSNLVFKPMICTATDYEADPTFEPYRSTSADFTTALPLRGVSATVRDKLICTADVKQVEKVCDRVRLADLTFYINETYYIFYTPLPSRNLQMSPMICNRYLCDNTTPFTWVISSQLNNKTIYQDSITNRLYIKDTDYTTVEDFVASLGDAELVYELVTPFTAPLTTAEISQAENLQTFNPQTNVQNSSNAEMTIKYNRRSPN